MAEQCVSKVQEAWSKALSGHRLQQALELFCEAMEEYYVKRCGLDEEAPRDVQKYLGRGKAQVPRQRPVLAPRAPGLAGVGADVRLVQW